MTLPLFPLNTVLFPGCVLDLQLFEARYLDMIGRCMKQGSGFGVVGIVDGREVGQAPSEHVLVGCEALITDFQQQDNGLLGIRVQGARRFQIQSTEVQKDQLLVAEVSWLDEQADLPLTEQHGDLQALLLALAEHPMVASLGMTAGAQGQQSLANQLAYLLPFTEQEKTRLLAQSDPGLRLAAIQALLDRLQGEALT
ncbi:ATP-dependent protease [Pseudomonas rhizosphaerae]|uniref:ATP-dependent protease n=1 Tax=Pseudomonas rhizosphaerae TaxID=216142 RepID=A0A089ZRH2_9PSED|nr:LON peptidase substrate-binding domain-containing protein [Pseudomonas rhizosphaerae]AIS19376.1 ATP-dependent protease [Pseudomonas rhizosphaerae]